MGFSHAGSDPRVFCEPWVSAPVCHHRNSANPFAIKPMTGARNSTRLNYVPMGLVVAQERRGYLTLRRGPSRTRTTRRRCRPEFLRERKREDAFDRFRDETQRPEHVLLAHKRQHDQPGRDVQSDQAERSQEPRPNDRPRGPQDREAPDELERGEHEEERDDHGFNMLPDGDDVDRSVGEQEERREDASTADPVPQDLRMVERVSEEQEAEAPWDGRQTNEICGAKVARCSQPARQYDLRFERAGHEEDREP